MGTRGAAGQCDYTVGGLSAALYPIWDGRLSRRLRQRVLHYFSIGASWNQLVGTDRITIQLSPVLQTLRKT